MRHFFIISILIYATYCDIKTLEVPDICFIAILFFAKEFMPSSILSFLIVAAIYFFVVLLASLLKKEVPIGMADAKIFASLCFSLGLYSSFLIFCYSSLFSGIYAAYLLLKKKSKDYAFPFLPFITLGMLSFCLQELLQSR